MPRSNPDGPIRHASLATAFELANHLHPPAPLPETAPYLEHLETSAAQTATAPSADRPTPKHRPSADYYQPPPITPVEESFRHGYWRARRSRILQALREAGVSGRRLENFHQCGSDAIPWQNQRTGEVRLHCLHCHDRFCLPCQQERANRIKSALHARVPRSKCLFVVLTPVSTDAPLDDQLSSLYKSAAKLRQSKWWKENVLGGFQCFECTFNHETKRWHPHLHLLVHASWLDQQELSDRWHKATGNAYVVHVSLVRGDGSAIRECTKYLAQPVHRSIQFVPERLQELITCLKGRRLCTTFGTWRSDPILRDDREPDPDVWLPIGTLHGIIKQASLGCLWSRHVLLYLQSRTPGRQEVVPPPVRDTS